MTETRPRVSVLMANYNGAPFIEQSIRSTLAQTMAELEIIVCDDASDDDSLAIARRIAAADSRVRVAAADRNSGISATRNRAIGLARGDWLAVQDSDDLFHPERLSRLLAAAARNGADLVADDLLEFPDDGEGGCKLLVGGDRPFPITAARLARGSHVLGYLKPLWRAEAMGGVRYDTDMIVAEDFDLAFRMVAAGARYVFHPEALYFYRKHRRSISSGSDRRKQASVLAGDDRLRSEIPMMGRLRLAALSRRRRVLRHMAYDDAVAALRRRAWRAALGHLARRPSSALVFRINLEARLRRIGRRLRQAGGALPASFVLVLARADSPEALRRPELATTLRLASAAGFASVLATTVSREADAPRPRRTAAVPPFNHLVHLPRATRRAAEELPSAEALALAGIAARASLVVAADPSLVAHLAYRIDARIPALLAERDALPRDATAFRDLLRPGADAAAASRSAGTAPPIVPRQLDRQAD